MHLGVYWGIILCLCGIIYFLGKGPCQARINSLSSQSIRWEQVALEGKGMAGKGGEAEMDGSGKVIRK